MNPFANYVNLFVGRNTSSLSDLGLLFCRQSILPQIESQISPKNIAAIARSVGGEIFRHPRRGSSAALGERSAQAERIHSLDVPGHGDEAPLAANAIESTQQELAESDHRFDDYRTPVPGSACADHRVVCLAVSADAKPWPRPVSGFPAPAAARQIARARRGDAAAAWSQSAVRFWQPRTALHWPR